MRKSRFTGEQITIGRFDRYQRAGDGRIFGDQLCPPTPVQFSEVLPSSVPVHSLRIRFKRADRGCFCFDFCGSMAVLQGTNNCA